MSLINILCGDGEVETVPHNYSFTFNEGTSALMLREYYFYVDNLQLLLVLLYFSLNTYVTQHIQGYIIFFIIQKLLVEFRN